MVIFFQIKKVFKVIKKLFNKMKVLLIISILFVSVISVYYVPMKKDHELGEHICRYQINSTSNIYVKPCGEGQYCQKTTQSTGDRIIDGWEYLYTCQNYTQNLFKLKQIDEKCESDYDCDSGLTCTQEKCKRDCGDETAYKSDNGWVCTSKYLKEHDFYYYKNFEDNTVNPFRYLPYSKTTGKINFHISTDKYYEIESIVIADYRTLDDGTFVNDEDACKSGYYLYFYPDGTLNDPYTGNDGIHNKMFKMCVSLEEYNRYSTDQCQVIYSINNNGNKTYNLAQVPLSYIYGRTISSITTLLDEFCSTNMLQFKLYKKYIETMTDEKRTKCNNLENYNYETCYDDELTKWFYFSQHPDIYSLYYTDEEDDNYKYVVKHLIQATYPYYQIGSLLNIKNSIILLLLLLSLII